jgi:SAM-dependent methyltransferase
MECNICGWTGLEFGALHSPGHSIADPNVVCPGCGSYERQRAAAYYLRTTGLLGSGRALEIGAGIMTAYRRVFLEAGFQYVSMDLWPGLGDIQGDLLAAPFASKSFDVIVCSHVLEHLSEDYTALAEIRRMLKPAGIAVLQLPYNDARYLTVEYGVAPTSRIGSGHYYGHARDYGLDILDRLRSFWPVVHEIQPLLAVDSGTALRYGFGKNFGTLLLCSAASKSGDPPPGRLCRELTGLKRHWLTQLGAYYIWLKRNGKGGALDDWLNAESTVAGMTKEEVMRWDLYSHLRPGARCCHNPNGLGQECSRGGP